MKTYKTLEEYVLNELKTVTEERDQLKQSQALIINKYEEFLTGEFIIVKRQVPVFVYGTRDSVTYYFSILESNNKSLDFAKECLIDKAKLYQFMTMHRNNIDYVCQLLTQSTDIIQTPSRIYTYSDPGIITTQEMFITEQDAYEAYAGTVLDNLEKLIAKHSNSKGQE